MGSRPRREIRLQFLANSVRAISALNRVVGHLLSWLALAIVLVCFTVVVQRYIFHTTQLWMQDLYVWLSGAMFTGVAGFALMRDEHVRVDILYRPWPIRKKAIADLIGTLIFLIPYVVVVLLYAWPFVSRSWRLYEGSANIGGMPGLFILKSFIIVFAVLVGLQGLAIIARSILVLNDREDLLPEPLRYRTGLE
jgi:TRAP-type mannitol/chloroaromatic compound transport system permease small subunit